MKPLDVIVFLILLMAMLFADAVGFPLGAGLFAGYVALRIVVHNVLKKRREAD